MIELFFEIIKHPLVYSCVPVLLFGIGYYFRSRINLYKERRTLLYQLITSRRIFETPTPSSALELKNNLNSIYRLFDITQELLNATNALTKILNLPNVTIEHIKPTLDTLILVLSKQSWYLSKHNKFISLNDLDQIFVYNPAILVEQERTRDFLLNTIHKLVLCDNVIKDMDQESQIRLIKLIENKDKYDLFMTQSKDNK